MIRHHRPQRGTAEDSSPSSRYKEKNLAWIWWEHYLRKAGWKQFIPNQHAESFGFLPVQYLQDYDLEEEKNDENGPSEKNKNKPNARDLAHFLMKHGKRRQHYAIGWDDLYFMVKEYGTFDTVYPTFLLDYNGPPLFGQKSSPMNKQSNACIIENRNVVESNTPENTAVVEERSSESDTNVALPKQKKQRLAHNLFSPKYEVGTKVRKEFGDFGWFDGKIVSICWKNQTYKVVYDDGDIEDYYFELPEIDNIVQHAQQKQKDEEEGERTALGDDDDDECSLDDEALQAQANAEFMAGVMEGCLFREQFQQLDAMEENILESAVTTSVHSNNNSAVNGQEEIQLLHAGTTNSVISKEKQKTQGNNDRLQVDYDAASDTNNLKRKDCITNSASTRGQPRRKVIRPKSQISGLSCNGVPCQGENVNETNSDLETKKMMMNKLFDGVPIKELSIVFKSIDKSNDEKKCHHQQEEAKKLEKDETQPTPPCPTWNNTQSNFQSPVPYYQGHPPPPHPMYHFYQNQYYYGPCPQPPPPPPPPFYYPCGGQYYSQPPPPPPPTGYAPNVPDPRFCQ